MENNTPNESNPVHTPGLSTVINTHQVHPNCVSSMYIFLIKVQSTHQKMNLTGNDDTPSAPDLQLDWSSSDLTSDSDSNDEEDSIEVVGTVNNNNKVLKTKYKFYTHNNLNNSIYFRILHKEMTKIIVQLLLLI